MLLHTTLYPFFCVFFFQLQIENQVESVTAAITVKSTKFIKGERERKK